MPTAFLSYAHKNHRAAGRLFDILAPMLTTIKDRPVSIWKDTLIEIGTHSHEEMQAALRKADIFMPFCTTALMESKYAVKHEIEVALALGATVVPIALEPMNFELTNWHGLEKLQVYHLMLPTRQEGKAFTQCITTDHQIQYAKGVMEAVYAALVRCGGTQ